MAEPLDERAELRALVREFSEMELRPGVAEWDRSGALDAAVREQLAGLGFFGLRVPEPFGGLGADLPTYADVLYELGRGEPAVALELAIHGAYGAELLDRYGTSEQLERWLPTLATGSVRICFAGSPDPLEADPPPDGVRASREGASWVLTGRTVWVAGGRGAELVVTAARTDPPNGEGGGSPAFGLFLVPVEAAGLHLSEQARTMGLRATSLVRFEFGDVRLGADAAIAEQGEGRAIVRDVARVARLGVAAIAAGIADAALEYAIAYADTREQFGRKLRAFEGMQQKLAEMAARAAAARAMVASAALADAPPLSATLAKVVASEAAEWVAIQAIQTFGGYGYMRDYPVEKLLRDAKALTLYEGVNETLRVEAARELYAQEA